MDALQLDLGDLLFNPDAERVNADAERIVWGRRDRRGIGTLVSQVFVVGGEAFAYSAGFLCGDFFVQIRHADPKTKKLLPSWSTYPLLSLGRDGNGHLIHAKTIEEVETIVRRDLARRRAKNLNS